MAGHAVGHKKGKAGHLLPAVLLALKKEGSQSVLFSTWNKTGLLSEVVGTP